MKSLYFPLFARTVCIAALMISILLGTAWGESSRLPPPERGGNPAPQGIFIKSGLAEQAGSVAIGVTWDKSEWLFLPLSDYLDLALDLEIGHWQVFNSGHDQEEFTQFGLTPMLRLPLGEAVRSQWFVEGGVGIHFIVPLYRTRHKHFGSSFNFQDLIGLGSRFGQERQHELAFYVSHFSNANISQPNPGENFLQLRYLHHFD